MMHIHWEVIWVAIIMKGAVTVDLQEAYCEAANLGFVWCIQNGGTIYICYFVYASIISYCCLCFVSGGTDSNKGKSKKWRRLLQFPHISQCLDLKSKIGEYFFLIIHDGNTDYLKKVYIYIYISSYKLLCGSFTRICHENCSVLIHYEWVNLVIS